MNHVSPISYVHRTSLIPLLLGSISLCLWLSPGMAQEPSIDWDSARELRQRLRAGETLTEQEQATLNRAISLRQGTAPPAPEGSNVLRPVISETICPVTELRISDTAYAAMRKPPGEGPFPAVIFLHGGLGQSNMSQLSRGLMDQPTHARFLAWGYVTVNATRRAIDHDPLDRGVVEDTLAIIDRVRQIPEVDPESIVLYGGSGGGTLALEIASAGDQIAAIAAGEPATIIYMGMFNRSHVDRDAGGQVAGDRRDDVMAAKPHELYTDELKQRTREKIKGIDCPVLILHGDQHPLTKFNLELFIPELKALDKEVTLKVYPGENHGFYWGRSSNPAAPLQANRDADTFFRKSIKTQPQAIDQQWVTQVPAS